MGLNGGKKSKLCNHIIISKTKEIFKIKSHGLLIIRYLSIFFLLKQSYYLTFPFIKGHLSSNYI